MRLFTRHTQRQQRRDAHAVITYAVYDPYADAVALLEEAGLSEDYQAGALVWGKVRFTVYTHPSVRPDKAEVGVYTDDHGRQRLGVTYTSYTDAGAARSRLLTRDEAVGVLAGASRGPHSSAGRLADIAERSQDVLVALPSSHGADMALADARRTLRRSSTTPTSPTPPSC